MTEGHKHRTIKVKPNGLIERVLRYQFYVTKDRAWIERSRLVFGPSRAHGERETDPGAEWWGLSLLGICHGLFGLTLDVGWTADD